MIISFVHICISSAYGTGTRAPKAKEAFSEEVPAPLPQRLAAPLACLPHPASPQELLQTLQALSYLMSLHMLFPG